MTREIPQKPEQEYLTREMAARIAAMCDLSQLGKGVRDTATFNLRLHANMERGRRLSRMDAEPGDRLDARKGARFELLLKTIQAWSEHPDLCYEVRMPGETLYMPLDQHDSFAKPRVGILCDRNGKYITGGIVDLRMENVRKIVWAAEPFVENGRNIEDIKAVLGMTSTIKHLPSPGADSGFHAL